MKIEFLYKDDTYKCAIEAIKDDLKLEEQGVTYTPVVQAGLNIFSFYKSGEKEETAKVLDRIKSSVLEALSSENLFIITDGVSSYFCKRLYPEIANFERSLRKVLYIASLKSNDLDIIKKCKDIEELEFARIYQILFSDENYVKKAKIIVNSNSPAYSKQDILKQLNNISESSLWDKLFNGQYEYISENFLDIKDGRNKVMHSRSISYAEFLTIKNILSKSNKLFDDIECELLEKDKSSYSEVISLISTALKEVGKVITGIAANAIATYLAESLGQLAITGETTTTIDEDSNENTLDVINVETEGEESNSTDEEEEGLCLIN